MGKKRPRAKRPFFLFSLVFSKRMNRKPVQDYEEEKD
jgi:hypothetical protein